ncbi:MAG: hypothetical protein HBSIN02_20650 [Bacteroidia bacterium]|nr:MAG: hypothetical protein HBSIN02_20650 [Bacteroidia bacterium]
MLWASRKLIAAVTGIATVGAVIVSFLLPEYYKSTATLLPETEKSKLAALGGLSDLAALAGVSVGGEGSLAKLYPTIIKSEAVLRNVIYAEYQTKKFKEPVNLIKFWEIEEETPQRSYEVALESLRDELDVSLDNKTSVVTVSIETTEPQLSADIVNKALEELDGFIRTKRTTSASEQRKWIEERLEQVKNDLEKSENKLKEFREKNRRVGDSPQLLLEQGRLMREVEINSTLYEELKRQFELARVEEIKNIPIVNVMDAARPSQKHESPKRALLGVTAFLFALTGMVIGVIAANRYRWQFWLVTSRLGFSQKSQD